MRWRCRYRISITKACVISERAKTNGYLCTCCTASYAKRKWNCRRAGLYRGGAWKIDLSFAYVTSMLSSFSWKNRRTQQNKLAQSDMRVPKARWKQWDSCDLCPDGEFSVWFSYFIYFIITWINNALNAWFPHTILITPDILTRYTYFIPKMGLFEPCVASCRLPASSYIQSFVIKSVPVACARVCRERSRQWSPTVIVKKCLRASVV